MNRSKVQSPAGDSAGTAKPKRQRGIWWVMKWSFLVFLVLVIATVLLNFRMGPGTGSPLVRVSRQTTYATSPLKPNGDVDYIAFVNQQYAVPADQNAMVGLIRVRRGDVVAGIFPAFGDPATAGKRRLHRIL